MSQCVRAEYDNSIFAVKVKLRNVKNLNGFISNVWVLFIFPLALGRCRRHRRGHRVYIFAATFALVFEIYYRLHTVKLLGTWVCLSGIHFCCCRFLRPSRNLCEAYAIGKRASGEPSASAYINSNEERREKKHVCIYIRWTISVDNKSRRSPNWVAPVFVTPLLARPMCEMAKYSLCVCDGRMMLKSACPNVCHSIFFLFLSCRSSMDNGSVRTTMGNYADLSEPIHFLSHFRSFTRHFTHALRTHTQTRGGNYS